MCPFPGRLSAALLEWKGFQDDFKGHRLLASGGIVFAASEFVFAGYSGGPFSNRAFNLRLRAAWRAIGVGQITAHRLHHSAATILLTDVGKDLREIQESATRTSAPRCAIPTSVMSKPARQRRRLAGLWSEKVGKRNATVVYANVYEGRVGDQKRGAEDRKPQLKAEPGYQCMVVHGRS